MEQFSSSFTHVTMGWNASRVESATLAAINIIFPGCVEKLFTILKHNPTDDEKGRNSNQRCAETRNIRPSLTSQAEWLVS